MAHPSQTHNKNYDIPHSTVSLRTFLITVFTGIILVFFILAYKSLETRSIIREQKVENEHFRNRITGQLDSTLKKQLVLFSKPMVWAIRQKMLEGDMQAVNQYIHQLVTEENFKEVSIVNPKGLIIASSDKSELGLPYSTFYNKYFLDVDTASLNAQRGQNVIITSPIYGLTSRIGTLSINYIMPKKD
ncbi:hypothetical protein [Pedobacter sp. Leaf132]|uniref:hypothetical protein n=1 Tax=Pedobacter sp. Leaf132 TaxID=2876557 RepID=UPI001E33A4A4|nr:hypothetical protein [Pedobacter sp. Leaf132]